MRLPDLLEERRKKYSIPDQCFGQVALFDRVLLYQIPLFDGIGDKVAPGSRIIAAQTTQEKRLSSAPRGIVITAGLAARDYLWANGVELGSIIKFVRLSPWHMPVGIDQANKEIYLQVVRVGDIVACEDLADSKATIVLDKKRGLHEMKVGKEVRRRADPEPNDDY